VQDRNLMAHNILSRLDVGGDGGGEGFVVVVHHANVGPDAGGVDRVLGEFEKGELGGIEGGEGVGVRGHPGGDGAFVASEPVLDSRSSDKFEFTVVLIFSCFLPSSSCSSSVCLCKS
jgi:hypothetical protein